MNPFRIIFFLSLLLPYGSVIAQFYTIRQSEPLRKHDPSPEVCEAGSPSIENNLMEIRQCSLPLKRNILLTSHYGYRKDPFTGKLRFHHGLDLRCANEHVLSMFHGKVKNVGYNKGLGNYVVLSHKIFEITYAHLKNATVEQGEAVVPGTIVGVSGNTGRSSGPHLHIELLYRGKRCNPLPLLAIVDKTVNQYKHKDRIMDIQRKTMTALEHVQEAYADEYNAYLKDNGEISSEERALLFLEKKEQDAVRDSQNR